MSHSPASRPLPRGGVEPLQRRITLPSWLISAVLHALVLVMAGLFLWSAPRRGAVAERTATVGIVLKHQDGDDRQYYQQPDGGRAQPAAPSATSAASLDEMLSGAPPVDPSSQLPPTLAVIGPGALEGGAVGTAIGADAGLRGGGQLSEGRGQTSVFGIRAEGHKFAYVFDRSASMQGAPLDTAKAELIASLQSLEDIHQFQIVFYNDQVSRFSPTGEPNRLFFATEQNKNLAARFIGSIVAAGGTDHERALMLAIRLQPDVIFFLTDADEPRLWPGQLEDIRRAAAGITIHTIEFGFGPQPENDNFLVRLARDNGGTHGYIDISRLGGQQR